jgi:hypothetical protein
LKKWKNSNIGRIFELVTCSDNIENSLKPVIERMSQLRKKLGSKNLKILHDNAKPHAGKRTQLFSGFWVWVGYPIPNPHPHPKNPEKLGNSSHTHTRKTQKN